MYFDSIVQILKIKCRILPERCTHTQKLHFVAKCFCSLTAKCIFIHLVQSINGRQRHTPPTERYHPRVFLPHDPAPVTTLADQSLVSLDHGLAQPAAALRAFPRCEFHFLPPPITFGDLSHPALHPPATPSVGHHSAPVRLPHHAAALESHQHVLQFTQFPCLNTFGEVSQSHPPVLRQFRDDFLLKLDALDPFRYFLCGSVPLDVFTRELGCHWVSLRALGWDARPVILTRQPHIADLVPRRSDITITKITCRVDLDYLAAHAPPSPTNSSKRRAFPLLYGQDRHTHRPSLKTSALAQIGHRGLRSRGSPLSAFSNFRSNPIILDIVAPLVSITVLSSFSS